MSVWMDGESKNYSALYGTALKLTRSGMKKIGPAGGTTRSVSA